jgi:hypothetical protein
MPLGDTMILHRRIEKKISSEHLKPPLEFGKNVKYYLSGKLQIKTH